MIGVINVNGNPALAVTLEIIMLLVILGQARHCQIEFKNLM